MKNLPGPVKLALIAFGVVFLTGAAGPVTCSQQVGADVAAAEAAAAKAWGRIKSESAYIKANMPVYIADAKAGIQILCALDTIAAGGASSLKANVDNLNPKVQSALDTTLGQAAKVSAGCARFAQTNAQQISGNDLVDLAASIWNGYSAYKSATTQVQTAVAASGG